MEVTPKLKEKVSYNNMFNRISVATWGSCYLRNMFNSRYNEDWKDLFEITSDYFWFSVVSAMSQPLESGNYSYNILKSVEGTKNYQTTRREILKTAFSELDNNKPDYLLVDFYSDAINGVWMITTDTFVGQTLCFSPDSTMQREYEEYIQRNSRKIDFRDKDFWNIWLQHLIKFCDKLVELDLQNKVILIEGDLCTTFVDLEGNKISDINTVNGKIIDKYIIKARKQMWNNMNQAFLEHMPTAKVLQMKGYGYCADYENQSVSVNHFEPNYYRSELGELCKIILKYGEIEMRTKSPIPT